MKLQGPGIQRVLQRLHQAAKGDAPKVLKPLALDKGGSALVTLK